MTTAELAYVVTGLTLAGFLQGLSGFGFGLIAMALLPMVLDLADTQAVVTVVSLVVCTANAVTLWRHFLWTGTAVLLISVGVGVPIGFALLTQLPADTVRRWLGGALCFMVGFEASFGGRAWRYPAWTQPLVGLAGGALAGAFNIGGPPLVAYLYSQPWSKQRIAATLSVLFVGCGLVRLSLLAQANELTPIAWRAAVWSVAPMTLALLAGNRLLDRIPQRALRFAVYAVLLALGVYYLVGLSPASTP
jgi:uncharacterized membrane protein YfcA